MSHFVRVGTKLTDKNLIIKALNRLGYESQEGNFTVTEYGTSEKAELLLDKALGLSLQQDGTYAFVGDPYHGSSQKIRKHYRALDRFTNELSTAYAIEETVEQLEAHQFFCSDNAEAQVGDDGLIHMTFESYT